MTAHIARENWYSTSVSCNTAIGTTAEINLRGFAGGFIYIPNGSSITSITWWAAPAREWDIGTTSADRTYAEAAYDEDVVAITQTVAADYAVEIPTSLFAAGAIYPVTNAAGTVSVSLKG